MNGLIGPVISSHHVSILVANMKFVLLIDSVHLRKSHYKRTFAQGFCFEIRRGIHSIFILLGISFSCLLCQADLKVLFYVLCEQPPQYAVDSYTNPTDPPIFHSKQAIVCNPDQLPHSLIRLLLVNI